MAGSNGELIEGKKVTAPWEKGAVTFYNTTLQLYK